MGISERNISSVIKRHQIIIVSVLLALFSLHLALTERSAVERGYISKEILSVTVSPIQRLVLGARGGVEGIFNDYVNLVGTKRENDTLKRDVQALRDEVNSLKEGLALSARLKELVEYKERTPFETVGASIIGYNIDRWTRTAVVNKGRTDGISRDLAVIGPDGVVGRIIEVNGGTSRVLLETDLRSNIDVIVQRTRVNAVAEGNGSNGLTLKYVRLIDDVRVGDIIVTSGYTDIFPKGLPIGEITKVSKGDDNFFKYVEVTPAVDIDRLEEILVLTDTGHDGD